MQLSDVGQSSISLLLTFLILFYLLQQLTNTLVTAKKKLEAKEFYKKKAREAKAQQSKNSFITTQTEKISKQPTEKSSEQQLEYTTDQPAEQQMEHTTEQPTEESEPSGSHSFEEITRALAHTKPDLTVMTENFLSQNVQPCFPVIFYFKHNTIRTQALIPGYSYGRGSVPPEGYRLFRNKDSTNQTDGSFVMSEYKQVYPSYKPIRMSNYESQNAVNTDYSFIFRPPPINKVLAVRSDSPCPAPKSCASDSLSECSSVNYQSSVGKSSVVSKGRGRGRGVKIAPVDSDTDSRKGRGRGRGSVGTRPPKSCDYDHTEKL